MGTDRLGRAHHATHPYMDPSGEHTRMEIRRIDEAQALALCRDEWNELVERSETHTIFQTWEWHQSWWKAFGDDAQPLVLQAWENGSLLGVAPLVLTRRRVLGRRRRVVELMGSGISDYSDFVVDSERPEVRGLLMQWLLDHRDLWDLLLLPNVPDKDHVVALAQQCENAGMVSDRRFLCNCPRCCCQDSEEGKQFLRHRRLRRARNYFHKQGTVTFRTLSSPEEITEELPAYFAQHIRRRAVTKVPSKFLDPRLKAFHRELGQVLAPTGRMLLLTTRLDSRPLAYELCFRLGDSLMAYDRCFDIDHSKHSPGHLSLANMIQYMLDQAMHQLDLGRGDEPYKLEIANRMGENHELRVYHSLLSRTLDRLVLRIISWLEASPRIGSWCHDLMVRLENHRWGPTG